VYDIKLTCSGKKRKTQDTGNDIVGFKDGVALWIVRKTSMIDTDTE
jgi:hypothetical protein